MESSDDANRGVGAGILFRPDHGRITECLFKFNVGQCSMSQETVFSPRVYDGGMTQVRRDQSKRRRIDSRI